MILSVSFCGMWHGLFLAMVSCATVIGAAFGIEAKGTSMLFKVFAFRYTPNFWMLPVVI